LDKLNCYAEKKERREIGGETHLCHHFGNSTVTNLYQRNAEWRGTHGIKRNFRTRDRRTFHSKCTSIYRYLQHFVLRNYDKRPRLSWTHLPNSDITLAKFNKILRNNLGGHNVHSICLRAFCRSALIFLTPILRTM